MLLYINISLFTFSWENVNFHLELFYAIQKIQLIFENIVEKLNFCSFDVHFEEGYGGILFTDHFQNVSIPSNLIEIIFSTFVINKQELSLYFPLCFGRFRDSISQSHVIKSNIFRSLMIVYTHRRIKSIHLNRLK